LPRSFVRCLPAAWLVALCLVVAGGARPAPAQQPSAEGQAGGVVLELLARGVFGAAANQGFGWMLGEAGLANDDRAWLRAELARINARLAALEVSVDELKQATAQSHYNDLVAHAAPILGDIDSGEAELHYIATLASDNPSRAAHRRRVLHFIGSTLLEGRQQTLHKLLFPSAPGARGILEAASDVERLRYRLWSDRSTRQVRHVYDYFALYAAVLTVLRTEYWHAHPDEFDTNYVGHVLAALAAQEQGDRDQFRLKGRPGEHAFVDLTTRYAWHFVGLAKLTWDETSHIRGNYPTKSALQHLFNSRGSERPANWIADETGISTHDIPQWVWTKEKRGRTHALAFNMRTGRFKEACTVHMRRSQPCLAGVDVRQGPDEVGQINWSVTTLPDKRYWF
jgi:hypothetical protein